MNLILNLKIYMMKYLASGEILDAARMTNVFDIRYWIFFRLILLLAFC
jgi:hypothetical protein